jgi:hypothetical protein
LWPIDICVRVLCKSYIVIIMLFTLIIIIIIIVVAVFRECVNNIKKYLKKYGEMIFWHNFNNKFKSMWLFMFKIMLKWYKFCIFALSNDLCKLCKSFQILNPTTTGLWICFQSSHVFTEVEPWMLYNQISWYNTS